MAVVGPDTDRAPGPDTDRAPGVAEAEVAAEVLRSFVAGLEAERYSGDDAVSLHSLFTRIERLAVAGKALAARRVDQCHAHLRSGHRSAAEFLAAQTGDSVGDAKGLLVLGEDLAERPGLDEAFRGGRLSRSRAALLADAVRVNPAKEEDLLEGAGSDSHTSFKERCLKAKAEGRTSEEEARHHRGLHDRRRCRTYTDTEGAFRLDASLPPVVGARVLSALETQSHRFFEQARASGGWETADAYRADALVALVTGTGVLVAKGRRTAPDTPAPDTRGRDASVRTPDPSATVLIRVDLDALRRGRVGDGERCEIPGVGPVPVDWARRRLGDSLIHLLVTDGVDVTTVYSPGRHIPASVRAALLERDSRCVVPGCDRRLGLENDHWVTDFAQGGRTSLDNLARLCRHHHRLRTHRGFQLLGGPGAWKWVPPETPVVSKRPARPPRGRAKAPPLPGAGPPRIHSED